MIAVIDYGAGNVRSVTNALRAIGQRPVLTNDPDELYRTSAVILPGVGAFGDSVRSLRRMNLIEPLNELIVIQKKPYLGICLGLQFLGEESFEQGRHEGFGWIRGKVELIKSRNEKYRIPHMGWNVVDFNANCPLFEGLNESPVFYFVHSYHLVVEEDETNAVAATCWHGTTITASIQKDNIFGVQFHPEKSQQVGLKLLENFIKVI